MKTLNFILGLLLGVFLMFVITFGLEPPATSQIFLFLFGGMAIGAFFTGLLTYLFMDRIVQAFYFSLYKRRGNEVPPVAEFLEEVEEVDEDEDENKTEDDNHWMNNPDWWKNPKKRKRQD